MSYIFVKKNPIYFFYNTSKEAGHSVGLDLKKKEEKITTHKQN